MSSSLTCETRFTRRGSATSLASSTVELTTDNRATVVRFHGQGPVLPMWARGWPAACLAACLHNDGSSPFVGAIFLIVGKLMRMSIRLLTPSQSPEGDGIPAALKGWVSLCRTAVPSRDCEAALSRLRPFSSVAERALGTGETQVRFLAWAPTFNFDQE